ncbi:MAG TPA: hypothetical protein VK211_28300 [Kamptonema sp.]|nr:hypothetical protein [Kamptonema sp.]
MPEQGLTATDVEIGSFLAIAIDFEILYMLCRNCFWLHLRSLYFAVMSGFVNNCNYKQYQRLNFIADWKHWKCPVIPSMLV